MPLFTSLPSYSISGTLCTSAHWAVIIMSSLHHHSQEKHKPSQLPRFCGSTMFWSTADKHLTGHSMLVTTKASLQFSIRGEANRDGMWENWWDLTLRDVQTVKIVERSFLFPVWLMRIWLLRDTTETNLGPIGNVPLLLHLFYSNSWSRNFW